MKKNIQKIQNYKKEGKKISALTAYDYSSAKYLDEAGIDIILVGDSLAQVALGYDDTFNVSIDEMLIFTGAVSRGVKDALVVADMPFGSFHIDKSKTMENAIKFIKKGANAIKLEGSSDFVIDNIRHLTQNSIPVMGHLGFTPMSVNTLSGHKIQGKDSKKTLEILQYALKLQEAGCFAIVLELMPTEAAKFISSKLEIPTIGIGAGCFCDGQILVLDDLIGKYDRFKPKFARQYANFKEIVFEATKKYKNDIDSGNFPNNDESFMLDENEVQKLESYR